MVLEKLETTRIVTGRGLANKLVYAHSAEYHPDRIYIYVCMDLKDVHDTLFS